MSDSRCPNSWFGSHHFQARYDSKFPDRGFKCETFYGVMDDLKEKTYIRDVCVKCGHSIERAEISRSDRTPGE